MTPPFPFEAVLMFGLFSILLLAGVLLRAWLGFLQKLLFPASLIGGLIGFALINLHGFGLDVEMIKAFAYHFFNISFISVGLTPPEFEPGAKSREAVIFKGSVWMAVLQAATFSLQALVGAFFVYVFMLLGTELFQTFGFLVPLAFNEGPGQALSIGRAWETFGFADASTIGLTFATIGFFFAFFVGVPLANVGLRKKRLKKESPDRFFLQGILPARQKAASAGGVTTHSSNLDCLAFHLAQVGLAYVITYFGVLGLTSIVPQEAAGIIWGFFFLFGLVTAIILRKILEFTPFGHLMDPPLQRRITGMSIDYLIVATGCGIELLVVWEYAAPIIVTAIFAGLLTTLLVIVLGRRLSDYQLERTVAMYGVVTGTVSCGLLLLRIVDPELKTPAAREIGFMNIFTVPVVGGLTFFLNVPLWWGWSLASTCLVLLAVFLISFALLYRRGFWAS
ncbi:MAG: hypothetical protein KGY38_01470 [Desulfobacterales bacterium]|nr:hypothetical protein [Desulfobacterales bacterium]